MTIAPMVAPFFKESPWISIHLDATVVRRQEGQCFSTEPEHSSPQHFTGVGLRDPDLFVRLLGGGGRRQDQDHEQRNENPHDIYLWPVRRGG